MYKTYIAGRLGLAGLDLSTPLSVWLDAVYAAWADAPHEVLQKAMQHFVVAEARLDPERARDTWGLQPEHQALSKGLGQGSGGYGAIPTMPTGTGKPS
jgi:hypothetical protein